MKCCKFFLGAVLLTIGVVYLDYTHIADLQDAKIGGKCTLEICWNFSEVYWDLRISLYPMTCVKSCLYLLH